MGSSNLVFKTIKNEDCPFYQTDDEFLLSGNALLLKLEGEKTFVTTAVVTPPAERETCRILVSDLNRLLVEHESVDHIPAQQIKCSGCSGLITVQPIYGSKALAVSKADDRHQNIDVIARMLSNFSIFQSLDRNNLKDIVSLLKLKKYSEGTIVLRKGEPAKNLFIILSGAVDVLDEEGVRLSTLRKGDVFGEMSLISGEPVGATISVVETATIIYLRGKDFRGVLNKFPSIQMYLARLLAQRLARSNVVRAEEVASGMIGRLSELPPAELTQTLNLNQKTGKLSFTLPGGSAELAFQKGELVSARYNDTSGQEAFYQIIREKEGRFKFEQKLTRSEMEAPSIGPFMEMLLEGLRRVDEENDTEEEPGQVLI